MSSNIEGMWGDATNVSDTDLKEKRGESSMAEQICKNLKNMRQQLFLMHLKHRSGFRPRVGHLGAGEGASLLPIATKLETFQS